VDETRLHRLLDSAIIDEPPIGPAAQNALRGGIRRRRRRRTLGVVSGAAVVAVAAVAIPAVTRSLGPPPASQHAAGKAAAIQNEAETWVMQQVSRAEMVSCDYQVCTDLVSKGFPFASLETLLPGAPDPLNSVLVVATADIRAQFGARLSSAYAPIVIASFGSGNARIDIRWVYPGGAAGYRAVERAALPARKAAGARLLANGHISVSAAARAQLLSGDVDPRLPLLVAAMARYHPVRIVDFVDQSPGGGPASLLRSVDLATADGAAHLTHAAYLGWMRRFVDAQRAPYHPAWIQQVTLGTGQAVLRVGFAAPSPLSPPTSGPGNS
jgi:hypothetical protein